MFVAIGEAETCDSAQDCTVAWYQYRNYIVHWPR